MKSFFYVESTPRIKIIECMWNIQRMSFYVENLHHYNNFFGRVQTMTLWQRSCSKFTSHHTTNCALLLLESMNHMPCIHLFPSEPGEFLPKILAWPSNCWTHYQSESGSTKGVKGDFNEVSFLSNYHKYDSSKQRRQKTAELWFIMSQERSIRRDSLDTTCKAHYMELRNGPKTIQIIIAILNIALWARLIWLI